MCEFNIIHFVYVLVADYIYQTRIPTHTRAYHTLQGLDSFWIEESTLGVCMYVTVYIHRKQRRVNNFNHEYISNLIYIYTYIVVSTVVNTSFYARCNL